VSDAGNISEERPIANTKGKGKAKGKKASAFSFPLLPFAYFRISLTCIFWGISADESDYTLKRKRVIQFLFRFIYVIHLQFYCQLGSPQISPIKKTKKAKTSGKSFSILYILWFLLILFPPGSPVSRVKAAPDTTGVPTNVSALLFMDKDSFTY